MNMNRASKQASRLFNTQIQKKARESIATIKEELAFLNAAGNPKYRLVQQSPFRYDVSRLLKKMAFWK